MGRLPKSSTALARTKGPKRAAIYCRVSTADQATEDKVSLDEQLGDCEAYAAEQGYEVVRRYRDVKSGTTSKRPDFQRMLADASAGEFDAIICWKVDRLGRGLFPMSRLLEVVEPAGIGIEAVKEKVDQRYLGLFASVGKIELDNIRERTQAAQRAYARKGQIPNAMVRYGYMVKGNAAPEVNPAEAKVLLEAATRYADGDRIADIARDFRHRGVPTRMPKTYKHGIAWTDPYLSRLIHDEGYATGTYTYAGEVVPFPVIYPAELWERVKARHERNARHAKRNTKVDYLLQHILWCRCCEHRFTARTKRYQYGRPDKVTGERKLYPMANPKRAYYCFGMAEKRMHHECRRPGFISADWIESAVWSSLEDALKRPEVLLEGLRARLRELEASIDVEDHEAGRQLAQLKLQRLEAARQRTRGAIDDATFDALTGEIDAQAVYWQERFEAEGRLRADVDGQRSAIANASVYLESLRARVDGTPRPLTFEERRELVLSLVDRVWVDGENAIVIEGMLNGPDASAPPVGDQVKSVKALREAVTQSTRQAVPFTLALV